MRKISIKKTKSKNYKKFYKRKHITFTYSITFLRIIKILIIMLSLFYSYKSKESSNNTEPMESDVLVELNDYKSFNETKQKWTDPFINKILKEISIKKHIFINNIKYYKKNKNIIHITSSLNNNPNYKYILLVSMNSLLMNCDKEKTFVIYHILCPNDFDESALEVFKSLFKYYSHNVEMIFYSMGQHFMHRKNTLWSQATFYRVLAPLFIDVERIIHLDGDNLIFTDLAELYNLDFHDNYVLGFYEVTSDDLELLGVKHDYSINAGVTLFNFKKMLEDNKVLELINLCFSDKQLKYVDQTAINYILYPKIGKLPSKFGLWNFEDELDIYHYHNLSRGDTSVDELKEALKSPGIIHFILCAPKAWYSSSHYEKWKTACEKRNNCSCIKYRNLWHSFANKTDYYEQFERLSK